MVTGSTICPNGCVAMQAGSKVAAGAALQKGRFIYAKPITYCASERPSKGPLRVITPRGVPFWTNCGCWLPCCNPCHY